MGDRVKITIDIDQIVIRRTRDSRYEIRIRSASFNDDLVLWSTYGDMTNAITELNKIIARFHLDDHEVRVTELRPSVMGGGWIYDVPERVS